MLFSVDEEKDSPQQLEEQEFVELDILERSDFQEWALEEPALLGEDLLIITSEYANFEQTRDRLDILALDPNGKLVVVELKRDEADKTTDLQAIKYASYCATLTAEEIQQDYREFWNERGEKDLSPDDVGEEFADFLDESVEEGVPITDDGWADFDLDDKPRILLVAGEFGIEVTAPVMWLIEEYDLDITCVVVQAYEHNDEFLLSNQQAIPVAEAEEYMTRRREKQEKQQESQRRTRAIEVLLDRGVLATGDIVEFDEDAKPNENEWEHDPS
ncbi:endonuclease NucS domain-containing protein, partial [Salinadaptatus halalkaliphilus]|uniref:endonuclease NucS domain-containing protein n=1 Tax=Salinadaptatus halalkaliphilus TaxID=2419781 RepID=UPI001C2B9617